MRRIIAVGDSTTHGYSEAGGGQSIPTQTWPYRLMVRLGETPTLDNTADIFINDMGDQGGTTPPSEANRIVGDSFEMLNSGVNGDDTVRVLYGRDTVLPRYQSDVLDREPDVVIINLGINDLGMMGGVGDYSEANTAARIATMTDQALAIGARVIICLIPSIDAGSNTWVTAYNALLADIPTTRENVYTCDLYAALCNVNGTKKAGMSFDNIHFTALGNQTAADAFDVGLMFADHDLDVYLTAPSTTMKRRRQRIALGGV